jgi:hypothetical protein
MVFPSGNGEQPYQVAISQAIALKVRQLHRRAWRQGRGSDFSREFRQAIDRLQGSPWAFGEPLYQLPALQMQIRCAVLGLLYIEFGVSEDRPLVFIKDVKLLSASK